MKIDFHTHGKLAKKLPFSREYTDWLFREAQKSGLDALCLTEHFNTLGFQEVYRYISGRCSRDGDSLVTENGFRIFPGMETDIAEGGHTLIIGPMECILEMNRRLEPHKEKGSFLPFEKLAELVSEYPVIFGAGHPYREGGHIPELPQEMLEKFFFLDVNGKDLARDRYGTWEKMRALSRKLNRPLVAGHHAHYKRDGRNRDGDNLGGHIASFTSLATMFGTGFNHFWRAPHNGFEGDLVYFQGHSSPLFPKIPPPHENSFLTSE